MFIASPDARQVPLMGIEAPLSILYMVGTFPLSTETFISHEIRALRAMGHDAVPLALHRSRGPCEPEDEALRETTFHLDGLPLPAALFRAAMNPAGLRSALQFAKKQTSVRPLSLLLAGARIALAARRCGSSHIHAHHASDTAAAAIVAARLAGLTCSFMAHGHDVYGAPTDLPLKLDAADVSFAVCEEMKRGFLRGVPWANVALVHRGVDHNRFHPRPGVPRNGRLLAIGPLTERSGYDVLLSALAAIPAWERPAVDVVGEGDLAERLVRKANDLDISRFVRFLGARSRAWIAEQGPAYLGFVAPRVICHNGDRDAGPIEVKEAMAMGLPVAASALMELNEIVTPDFGRLVRPRHFHELGEALLWLTRMPEDQRVRMGQAGRRRVEADFTIERQASDVVTAIQAFQAAAMARVTEARA